MLDRIKQHVRLNSSSTLHNHLIIPGSSFTVTAYLLPAHMLTRTHVLALEQYLMFLHNPSINESKVGNSSHRILTPEQLVRHREATANIYYVYYKEELIHIFPSGREGSLSLGKLEGYFT